LSPIPTPSQKTAQAMPTDAMNADVSHFEKKMGQLEAELPPDPVIDPYSMANAGEKIAKNTASDEAPLLDMKALEKKAEKPQAQMAGAELGQFFQRHMTLILVGLVIAAVALFWGLRRVRQSDVDNGEF
jgi:hypothetical protein